MDDTSTPLVEARDLWKVYRRREGAVTALANVDLRVNEGDFVALLGPSGCGKSTLLNLVGGLDEPTHGSVSIRGSRIQGPADGLGVVFQRDLLLEWRTALENVLLPYELCGNPVSPHRERARQLLDMVGLSRFEGSFPWQMSGGMRQRVSICRALIREPELLLMDEPFGAVDALSREALNVELSRLCQLGSSTTVLFVTHDIDEAVFLANRVAIFSPRPGRLIKEQLVSEPLPRTPGFRDTDVFQAHVHEIRDVLRAQGILEE